MAACANAIAKRPRRPDLSMPLPLGVMEACFSLKTRQIQASTPGGSPRLSPEPGRELAKRPIDGGRGAVTIPT
jgi:hypothetical protein